MVSLDYQIIDAFTSEPFAGNPAAVIVLDTDEYPEDSFLLNIAREFNLSETAFLIPFHTSGNDFFHLRWFTPTTEVDLCGHATLASAHVLFSTQNKDSSSLTFHTKSGALIATKRGDLIELDFPEELVGAEPFTSSEEQAPLEGVLEVALPDTKILNIARNRVDYLIEIDSTAHGLQSLPIDISALKHFQSRGVIITTAARVPGLDFHSRGFFPLSGVDEDPVTGSAHCMLGPYWIEKLGKKVVRATQGGPRTGEIEVEWDRVKKRVYLRGSAVTVAKGSIMKPTVHPPAGTRTDSHTLMDLPQERTEMPHEDVEEERSCLVLYASQTGNAEDIAHGIGRMLERMHIKRRICAMDQCDLMDLMNENRVIFVASTTGQGEIPDNMKQFWPAILRRSLHPTLLDHLSFALFGLGDSSYPKYNFTAKKLYRRLIQLGARPMVERGEGDESHPQGIDAGLALWLKDLRQVMEAEMPLPLGLTPIPDDCLLPPTYSVKFGKHALGEETVHAAPTRSGLTLAATVTQNDRITADDHWQDVRHIVMSIPSPHLAYDPGDIAVLWPENPKTEVERLIEVCKWQDIANTPLNIRTIRDDDDDDDVPALPSPCTLRTLARYHFDFMSVPKRRFFELLRHFVTNEMHVEKLTEFCGTTSDNQEDLWDYTTRPRRNILEVLADFKETLSLPIDYVLDLFPVLRPRQYSLASSLKVHPGEAHVLAAIVEYKTSMHIPRVGIASRWLRSLKPGTRLTMGLIRGAMRPPPTPGAKCVMIAPGTGVAPMRALIQDRIATSGGSDGATEQLLVFGNRQREKDFLLRFEWESYVASNQLSLSLAFSRDTPGPDHSKFYVQHALRREWRRVDTWLRKDGGYVYVCGSSGKMPQAVREALVEIFQRGMQLDQGKEVAMGGSGGRDEAEAVLVKMEKEGRYLQETW